MEISGGSRIFLRGGGANSRSGCANLYENDPPIEMLVILLKIGYFFAPINSTTEKSDFGVTKALS